MLEEALLLSVQITELRDEMLGQQIARARLARHLPVGGAELDSHALGGGEFGAYLGPALHDLPELDNVIIENPSEDGPFGAKAIGEMANNAQPPAIATAIFDAVGVWVTEMPATPERVLEALEAKREPRRDGKRVIFDEHISVRTVSSNGGEGFLGVDA